MTQPEDRRLVDYSRAGNVVGAEIRDPESEAHKALKEVSNATYARSIGAAPRFVEILLSMFGSPQTVWVTGQTSTPTTLTGEVSAGATSLPLASAAHIDGVALVLGSGTPDQQIVRITGGGGTNTVTVAPALAKGWPSGTPVEPLWANASHLTGPGYKALARHIVQSAAFDDFPADGKVTFLGNSWVAHGGTVWAEQVTARFPNATVVNAGVSGNTSASLINRFATDVPADSDVVVFNEPGVNDTYALLDSGAMMKSLDTLVRLVRGIGAVPVYVGPPPLTEHQTVVATRSVEMGALLAVPEVFPAAPVSVVLDKMPPASFPDSTSIGIGLGSLARGTTGTKNTALGQLALASVTTGVGNTSLGNLAGSQITTGSNNLSIGDAAQQAVTTGSSNVGIGQGANASVVFTANNVSVGGRAGFSISSGHTNTNIGNQTGYASGGDPANATTTATHQTNVGSQAGQGSATQASRITTLGYRATASAYNSVAIGAETAVTVANQVGIGPRSQHIDNAPAEPATPASGGVLFVQGGALKFKGSSGTVTTLAPA